MAWALLFYYTFQQNIQFSSITNPISYRIYWLKSRFFTMSLNRSSTNAAVI
jgi:hypothetical protein